MANPGNKYCTEFYFKCEQFETDKHELTVQIFAKKKGLIVMNKIYYFYMLLYHGCLSIYCKIFTLFPCFIYLSTCRAEMRGMEVEALTHHTLILNELWKFSGVCSQNEVIWTREISP